MRIVDAQQMQRMDFHTIENVGIPSLTLMENAARSWVAETEKFFHSQSRIFIFCGSGNNGGDGYAIARILANRGFNCLVIAATPPKSEDCQRNAKIWSAYGEVVTWEQYCERKEVSSLNQNDFLIDSLLGTGFKGEIRGIYATIIEWMNTSLAKTLAVDIPSGVNGSNGDVQGLAVEAFSTVTFQLPKVGHLLYPGRQFSGKVQCQKISILEHFMENDREYHWTTLQDASCLLPPRNPESYKNQYGHLLCYCGNSGTLGAAILANHAAMKTGTGLVTAALPQINSPSLVTLPPEVMIIEQETLTPEQLKRYSAILVGCGVGRIPEKWERILDLLQDCPIPLVLDADAFPMIQNWDFLKSVPVILTPHPGEFEMMTGWKKPKNNEERLKQGFAFTQKNQSILIMKGAPSLIFVGGNRVFINSTGNAGMATAGSGDVLAGIVSGLLAQGLEPLQAALLGTWLHGKAGDFHREKEGMESLVASSLIENLFQAFQELKTK